MKACLKLLGKAQVMYQTRLGFLELDEEIQKMVISGQLSMGHARALIGVPNALSKAKEIVEKKLSVRDIEKTTSKFKKQKNQKP